MAKLICGCGYLGMRVARRWQAAGQEVWAVTRSADRAAAWAASGLHPLQLDLGAPFTFPAELPVFDTVLFAVGWDRTPNQSLEEVYVGGLRHVLQALPQCPERFVYISSTGVYGHTEGTWVNESTPCRPEREGGVACLAAEQLLASSPCADRRLILRLAGIYGPGRVPKLEDVRHGRAIPAAEQAYLNLIHVEDAAEIVCWLVKQVEPPNTFLVSDGHPVARGDFYREVARLLQAPAPRFAPEAGSPAQRARMAGDKRIDNGKLRSQLDSPLAYPTYREGLAQIIASLP